MGKKQGKNTRDVNVIGIAASAVSRETVAVVSWVTLRETDVNLESGERERLMGFF